MEKHTCKTCGEDFEEYKLSEDCHSCNDGYWETFEDGEYIEKQCPWCGGSGDFTEIQKTYCKKCNPRIDDDDDDDDCFYHYEQN